MVILDIDDIEITNRPILLFIYIEIGANDEVVLVSTWASMFGMRVQIALTEKGVELSTEKRT
ncbi:hypothetical protein ACSBR1_011884 [Camellia fascicularis]